MAWGRIADMPEELVLGLRSKSEGGTGNAELFFNYCDRRIENFL
jgi:retinol dehydrogenase-12